MNEEEEKKNSSSGFFEELENVDWGKNNSLRGKRLSRTVHAMTRKQRANVRQLMDLWEQQGNELSSSPPKSSLSPNPLQLHHFAPFDPNAESTIQKVQRRNSVMTRSDPPPQKKAQQHKIHQCELTQSEDIFPAARGIEPVLNEKLTLSSSAAMSEEDSDSETIGDKTLRRRKSFDGEFGEENGFFNILEKKKELSFMLGVDFEEKSKVERTSFSPVKKSKIKQLRSRSVSSQESDESKLSKLESIFGFRNKEEKAKKQEIKAKKKLLKKIKGGGGTEKKFLRKTSSYSSQEVEWLFELAENGDEQMKLNAILSIATSAYPIELIPNLRQTILSKQSLVDKILELVTQGALVVHKEVSTSEIEVEKMIAAGASAKVYKAKYKGKPVALKKFDTESIGFSMSEFRRELALLNILVHENILPCFGAMTKQQNISVSIISELMTKGTLSETLKELKGYFDLQLTVKWALGISKAMAYIHSHRIIHRDLKSLNVLVNDNLTVKLIDFGTSRIVEFNKSMTGNMGTTAWMAPEVLQNARYSQKADVYSFGIILCEMITSEEPFHEEHTWAIPPLVLQGKRPSYPSDINKEYEEIMKKCWDQNPDIRPSFEHLVILFEKLLEELKYN